MGSIVGMGAVVGLELGLVVARPLAPRALEPRSLAPGALPVVWPVARLGL